LGIGDGGFEQVIYRLAEDISLAMASNKRAKFEDMWKDVIRALSEKENNGIDFGRLDFGGGRELIPAIRECCRILGLIVEDLERQWDKCRNLGMSGREVGEAVVSIKKLFLVLAEELNLFMMGEVGDIGKFYSKFKEFEGLILGHYKKADYQVGLLYKQCVGNIPPALKCLRLDFIGIMMSVKLIERWILGKNPSLGKFKELWEGEEEQVWVPLCGKCGRALEGEGKFCGHCGTKVR